MEGKVCCFIGHRKIEKSIELKQRVKDVINDLIENKGVITFLFGSRSEFDDLCHSIVTDLQKNNPQIKRIIYTCQSEYLTINNIIQKIVSIQNESCEEFNV